MTLRGERSLAGSCRDRGCRADHLRGSVADCRTDRESFIAADLSYLDLLKIGQVVVAIIQVPTGQRILRMAIDLASEGTKISMLIIEKARNQFLDQLGLANLP